MDSDSEIARQLKMTPAAVYVNKNKALKQLRSILFDRKLIDDCCRVGGLGGLNYEGWRNKKSCRAAALKKYSSLNQLSFAFVNNFSFSPS